MANQLSFFAFLATASASSLVCSEVKSLYQEAQCCDSSGDTPVTPACVTPTPNYGFPSCYSTFQNLDKQYVRNLPLDYIPSNEGYVYLPYSNASLSDCASLPPNVVQHIPHASPLGMAFLSTALDSALSPHYEGMLAMAMTGSWNRYPGTPTGFEINVARIASAGNGVLKSMHYEHLIAAEYVNEYQQRYRPSDIMQLFPASEVTLVSLWTYEDAASYGVGKIVTTNGTHHAVDLLLPLPGMRRLAQTATHVYMAVDATSGGMAPIPQYQLYVQSGLVPATSKGAVLSILKTDLLSKSNASLRVILHDVLDPDGIDVVNGDLYVSTSQMSSDSFGNSLLKVANIESVVTQGNLPVTPTVVASGLTYVHDHHPLSTMKISPDGEYAVMSMAASCNLGCQGVVFAVKLSDGSKYEVANGLRNPTGFAFKDGYIFIADMGSDLGLGVIDYDTGFYAPAGAFGPGVPAVDLIAGGQNGPNDRVVAQKWYTPTKGYAPVCMDDPFGRIAASGLSCPTLVASEGCTGTFAWTSKTAQLISEMFGGFETRSVGMDCPLSCNSCPA
jgi:glucose/arabinose dehydrogenase